MGAHIKLQTTIVITEKPSLSLVERLKNIVKFSPQVHDLCYNIVEKRAVVIKMWFGFAHHERR